MLSRVISTAISRRPCKLRYPPHIQYQGFTLIEMMVSIAILVIALGVALPSMTDWVHNSQIRNASQSLQSALRSAQSQAQSQSRVVAVILTSSPINEGQHLGAQHTSGALKHWAAYTVPLDQSDEAPRLLQVGTFHGNGDIMATLSQGQAICFNSLGRLSRQALKDALELDFTLDCGNPVALTMVHSSMSSKPVTLSVAASGKTALTY